MNSLTRRDLATGVVAATALSYSRILGANDRVGVGYIGIGNRLFIGWMCRDWQAKRAAHRAADRLPPERIRALPGSNQSRRARCLRDAGDGPEVARVLNIARDDHDRIGSSE